jgi:hypothetical protein
MSSTGAPEGGGRPKADQQAVRRGGASRLLGCSRSVSRRAVGEIGVRESKGQVPGCAQRCAREVPSSRSQEPVGT